MHSVPALAPTQKALLSRAGITTPSELILANPNDLSKKLKLPLSEVRLLVEKVCEHVAPQPRRLDELLALQKDDVFTTGDNHLDALLGGGIRTGAVWDLAGESGSGKTQLALQLSLTVQLPPLKGGLEGSAYYISTSAFSLRRLVELASSHPLFEGENSDDLLSGVHKLTSAISTPEALLHVLRNIIPSLLSPPTAPAKPAKLLVIDSLTPLFRLTNTSLFDRSRYLHEIGSLLHGIASKYCMAIVVINEVSDVFEAVAFSPSTSEISQASASVSAPGTEGKEKGKAKAKPHAYGDGEVELTYKDQSRWFNRSAFSEDKKEAGLGLVWANIVNGRIVLRRTAELFYLHDPSPSEALGYDAGEGEGEGEGGRKRRKTNDGSSIALQPQPQLQQQSTIIRRLSLIFSGLCAPFEVPFVVLKEGVRVLPPPPAIQSELSATVEAETGADIEVENEEDEEDKKTEVDEYEVSEWGSEVWGSLPVGVGGTATTGLADVDEGS